MELNRKREGERSLKKARKEEISWKVVALAAKKSLEKYGQNRFSQKRFSQIMVSHSLKKSPDFEAISFSFAVN